jgi:hypothetical protein
MPIRLLLLCMGLLATGCASLTPVSGKSLGPVARGAGERTQVLAAPTLSLPEPDASERRLHRQGRAIGPDNDTADAWEELLLGAGLDSREERPLSGSALTPPQAARLLGVLVRKPVTLGTFPPRMAACHLLREVLARGEVSRSTLLRRVERFTHVAVLRPDGYLAWARTGHTQQRVGPVEWKEGSFRAGLFELGRFYVSNGSVLRLADERLEPVDGPVFTEVYDDADYVGRTLDGAEAAAVKLALALGQLLTRPLDSLAALKNLPADVAALIAASPGYFERFRHMTRGEQVQAVAELATNLLLATGTATATTRTVTGALAGAEATVPVLSLSAQGVLAVERVAVPVGRAAAVLGGGPGAVIALHQAGTVAQGAGPSKEPGQWGPAKESMKPPARRYQEQITGHSADEAYWVGGMSTEAGGVKFDGFKDGVLLEAKGPNYANKFTDSLDPKYWFEPTGAKGLLEQADRQSQKVRGMGIPIEWHVAEKTVADALRKLLRDNLIQGIKVVHTPAL